MDFGWLAFTYVECSVRCMWVFDDTRAVELLVIRTHCKGSSNMQLDVNEAFRGVYDFRYGDRFHKEISGQQ